MDEKQIEQIVREAVQEVVGMGETGNSYNISIYQGSTFMGSIVAASSEEMVEIVEDLATKGMQFEVTRL